MLSNYNVKYSVHLALPPTTKMIVSAYTLHINKIFDELFLAFTWVSQTFCTILIQASLRGLYHVAKAVKVVRGIRCGR